MTTNDDEVYLRGSLWGLLVILGLILIGLCATVIYAMGDELVSIQGPGLYRCTEAPADTTPNTKCQPIAEDQVCATPQGFVGPSAVTTDPQLTNWAHEKCTTQQAIEDAVRVCMHTKGVRWDHRP